jgi:hypothetical protein
MESIASNTKLLKNESIIYQFLNEVPGVPSVKWFGKDDNYYLYKSWYFVQKDNALKEFIEHPYFGCGGGNLLNVINLKYKKT